MLIGMYGYVLININGIGLLVETYAYLVNAGRNSLATVNFLKLKPKAKKKILLSVLT